MEREIKIFGIIKDKIIIKLKLKALNYLIKLRDLKILNENKGVYKYLWKK